MVPIWFDTIPDWFYSFYGFRLFSWFQVNFFWVLKVPGWFFIVPGGFVWLFMVPGEFYMVPSRFL